MSTQEIDSVAHTLHETMEYKILNTLDLRDGAKELFDWAINNEVKLAICSASTEKMLTKYFSDKDLLHVFSEIHSTAISDMDKRKPFPYPYLKTMEKLDVAADQTLVIEDSPKGIESSNRAGAYTIAIENIYLTEKVVEQNPKHLVQDFLAILKLLSFA